MLYKLLLKSVTIIIKTNWHILRLLIKKTCLVELFFIVKEISLFFPLLKFPPCICRLFHASEFSRFWHLLQFNKIRSDGSSLCKYSSFASGGMSVRLGFGLSDVTFSYKIQDQTCVNDGLRFRSVTETWLHQGSPWTRFLSPLEVSGTVSFVFIMFGCLPFFSVVDLEEAAGILRSSISVVMWRQPPASANCLVGFRAERPFLPCWTGRKTGNGM